MCQACITNSTRRAGARPGRAGLARLAAGADHGAAQNDRFAWMPASSLRPQRGVGRTRTRLPIGRRVLFVVIEGKERQGRGGIVLLNIGNAVGDRPVMPPRQRPSLFGFAGSRRHKTGLARHSAVH